MTEQATLPVSMKPYMAAKQVMAGPMTRGAYNEYRGWDIPANESPSEEGYLIKYPDGYVSWCPKGQFEKWNLPLTVSDKITEVEVELMLDQLEDYIIKPKTTVVEVHYLTGFFDMAHSTCVSPENYDHELGVKVATEKIRDRIWGFLGFMLQWTRHGLAGNGLPEVDKTDSEPPLIDSRDSGVSDTAK